MILISPSSASTGVLQLVSWILSLHLPSQSYHCMCGTKTSHEVKVHCVMMIGRGTTAMADDESNCEEAAGS